MLSNLSNKGIAPFVLAVFGGCYQNLDVILEYYDLANSNSLLVPDKPNGTWQWVAVNWLPQPAKDLAVNKIGSEIHLHGSGSLHLYLVPTMMMRHVLGVVP